jgi:hypothetical protein
MDIFEKITEAILNGGFSGAISGFQTEQEQRLMDYISMGWEIEDPEGKYSEVDRKMSAVGSVEYYFSYNEEEAGEFYDSI